MHSLVRASVGIVALLMAICATSAASAQLLTSGSGGAMHVRQACSAELAKFCGDVQLGGGRKLQCLREHRDQLSDACKAALTEMQAARRGTQGRVAPQSN